VQVRYIPINLWYTCESKMYKLKLIKTVKAFGYVYQMPYKKNNFRANRVHKEFLNFLICI